MGRSRCSLPATAKRPSAQWWLRNDPEPGARIARFSSSPTTAAATAPTRAGCKIVRPELAVASLGRNNEYGHPHSETVSLLRRTEIPLLRTDQLGTITITSDGRDWQVAEPALGRAGRPTQADVDRVAAAAEDDSRAQLEPNPDAVRQISRRGLRVQEREPAPFCADLTYICGFLSNFSLHSLQQK